MPLSSFSRLNHFPPFSLIKEGKRRNYYEEKFSSPNVKNQDLTLIYWKNFPKNLLKEASKNLLKNRHKV